MRVHEVDRLTKGAINVVLRRLIKATGRVLLA